SRPRSKSKCDGATFTSMEQLRHPWSNSRVHGATPNDMEQLSRRWSNSKCDGATFAFMEQLRMIWSNFRVHGATPNEMEQLSRPWSNSQREIYIKTPRPLSVRRAVFVNFIDLDPFLTSGLIRLHGLVLLPHLMKRSTHSILHLFSHL